jgi:hypothetical protein
MRFVQTEEGMRSPVCEWCGKGWKPMRSDAKFCSRLCRQRARRDRLGLTGKRTPIKGDTSKHNRESM